MQIPSNRSISEGCTEIRQKCWTQEDVYDNYLEEGGFVAIEEDVVTQYWKKDWEPIMCIHIYQYANT